MALSASIALCMLMAGQGPPKLELYAADSSKPLYATLAVCPTVQEPATKPEAPVVETGHKKALDADIELGKKYSLEVEKQLKLSKNEAMIARVERVGKEMADIANRTHVKALWGDKKFSPFEYSFKVVEGKDVNAFSLPGGFIYVYEGLLTYVESDDELAGVLAHEIAHASLRHIATLQREAQKNQVITIPAILIAILSGGATAGAIMTGTNLFQIAQSGGWTQKAEQAADYAGFEYMRRSKYDPTGSLTVVERLAWDARNRPKIELGIYQTHPPSEKRAREIGGFMREENYAIRRSVVTTSFKTQLKPLEGGVIEATFAGSSIYRFKGEGAQSRAEAAAKRFDSFFDSVPSLYEVRSLGKRVVGGKSTLIEVENEDLEGSNATADQLSALTAKNVQNALFTLAYRVWQPG